MDGRSCLDYDLLRQPRGRDVQASEPERCAGAEGGLDTLNHSPPELLCRHCIGTFCHCVNEPQTYAVLPPCGHRRPTGTVPARDRVLKDEKLEAAARVE